MVTENPYIKQFPDLMAGKTVLYVHGFASSGQSGTVRRLQEVLPHFDRERVHPNDIRKLISWYNLLVKSGNTDFEEKTEEAAEAEK